MTVSIVFPHVPCMFGGFQFLCSSLFPLCFHSVPFLFPIFGESLGFEGRPSPQSPLGGLQACSLPLRFRFPSEEYGTCSLKILAAKGCSLPGVHLKRSRNTQEAQKQRSNQETLGNGMETIKKHTQRTQRNEKLRNGMETVKKH